ncbi:MAG: glycosyltransferase family 2 protein, partial [Deltaproteobacteria bacterium]|nr:glycosyltransferase family 2 protein [Deltaproteobacteria bacterium]
MMPYVSVIIPAFNEAGVIEDNLNEVAEYLRRHIGPDKGFEIIVVDDGSSDSTAEIIDRLATEMEYVIALHHPRNLGRGKGVRTGFEKASGQFIFTLDADLSYSPEIIAKLLPPLETGEADVALASVYHPQGKMSNVPLLRALISRLGNWLLSRSLGGEPKTVTCLVRGYTREVIESLELFSDDKEIHLEIIQKARMLGFRIIDVPSELNWRSTSRTSSKKGLSLGGFRDMASRHLFFNFLFRPGMLSWLPILILGIVFITVSVMIVYGYHYVLARQPADTGWLRFYFALREHIIFAKVSYFIWSLCLLLLFQFSSLVFIAKQNNHHYKELFSFLSRLNKKIKEIE